MSENTSKPSSNARPANLLQPGETLAGYLVETLLGKGGMGEVYRVRQVSMDRVVALKVLAPRMVTRDPTFADRFFAEARAAGKLNHPNIVKVHDVGSAPLHTADGGMAHYFSMEYIDGESLQTVLDREGALPEKRIADIMRGMAAAVGYAAQVGLVHRDIKPDNIMLSSTGQVKLADLGLATASQDEASHVVDRDEQGRIRVMGTPLYMSPEQARGQPLDHRSDQYSLGATLYHLLTGQPPFQAADTREVMRMHVTAPVPDPVAIKPEVSEAWADLSMRLMQKLPEQRFATPEALNSAVDAAIAGVSLSRLAELDGVKKRAQEGLAWYWWLVIGVVIAVILAGLVMLGSNPAKVAPAKPMEPAEIVKSEAVKPDVIPSPDHSPLLDHAKSPSAKPMVPPEPVVKAVPAVVVKPPAPVNAPTDTKPAPSPVPVPVHPLDPDLVTWSELRTKFNVLRQGYHYVEAKDLAENSTALLKSDPYKARAKDLAEMVDKTMAAEAAIKGFMKEHSITIDVTTNGIKTSMNLKTLNDGVAVLEGPDQKVVTMPRSQLAIPWNALLRQAMDDQRTEDPEVVLAVSLWFWQRPVAEKLLAALKDRRFAAVAKAIDGKP